MRPSEPSLASGFGQDSAFAPVNFLKRSPSCGLVHCRVLLCGCFHLCQLSLLSSLHWFPLPRAGFSALALTSVCLPPSGPSSDPGRANSVWQFESALEVLACTLQVPLQNPQPEDPDPSCSTEKVVPHLARAEGLGDMKSKAQGRVVHPCVLLWLPLL